MNPAVRPAALWSIAFALLMFVPIGILSASIGWPASLDYPAARLMPLILEQEGNVRFGYLVYLLYSVVFFPTVAALARVLGDGPLTRLATQFALVSTLARAIGILRWLTVMPLLAGLHAAAPNQSLETAFTAINSFGGGIGELLGVSLFGALAVGLIAWRALETRAFPAWLGVWGLIAALGLVLPWLEVFGVNLGPLLSLGVANLQLWFLALGVTLLRAAPRANLARA
jgi:hypothetical protein